MGYGGKQDPGHDEQDRSDGGGGGEDRIPMTPPLTVRRSGSSGLGGL
jgi:hypothetical protein